MLTLTHCAPQGSLSNVSGFVTDITAGIVDVGNGAVEKITDFYPVDGKSTSNTTSNDNTTDSTVVHESTDISQEDFAKFIVDIFTGI